MMVGGWARQWDAVIPKKLRSHVLHRRELLGGLARTARETLLELRHP